MIDNSLYIDVLDIAASNEIASKTIKTQTLNVLKSKLETLLPQVTSPSIKSMIYTNLDILNDCYVVDMYKFQLKAMADILQKDIKNIEEIIALEI